MEKVSGVPPHPTQHICLPILPLTKCSSSPDLGLRVGVLMPPLLDLQTATLKSNAAHLPEG